VTGTELGLYKFRTSNYTGSCLKDFLGPDLTSNDLRKIIYVAVQQPGRGKSRRMVAARPNRSRIEVES